MKTAAAKTAKAIRKELKQAFPNTKFSVRSSNFANGNSVHIEWIDGPTVNSVNEITNKYQYGEYNGMIDMYEYNNTRDDVPQAKYVQTQRFASKEIYQYLTNWIKKTHLDENGFNDYDRTRMVYQEFNRLHFPELINGNLRFSRCMFFWR